MNKIYRVAVRSPNGGGRPQTEVTFSRECGEQNIKQTYTPTFTSLNRLDFAILLGTVETVTTYLFPTHVTLIYKRKEQTT